MDFETKFYSAGIPLAATVHIPDKNNADIAGRELVKVPDGIACSAEKYPMVVQCHGGNRYRNDGNDRLAQVLGEHGIASIRFDFRGCGENARNRYRLLRAAEMPHDVKCAIDFCESLPFVDRDRIGITGVSMGGVQTIIAAATEDRIRSAAPMAATAVIARAQIRRMGKEKHGQMLGLLREDARITAATGHSRVVNRMNILGGQGAGVFDANILEALMFPGNNAYGTFESMREYMDFSCLDYTPRINCPIFVIHGAEDELVEVSDAYDIYNTLPAGNPKKRIRIYEGVDHNIPICDNREVVFADIAQWFEETL